MISLSPIFIPLYICPVPSVSLFTPAYLTRPYKAACSASGPFCQVNACTPPPQDLVIICFAPANCHFHAFTAPLCQIPFSWYQSLCHQPITFDLKWLMTGILIWIQNVQIWIEYHNTLCLSCADLKIEDKNNRNSVTLILVSNNNKRDVSSSNFEPV